jgi:phage-related protein
MVKAKVQNRKKKGGRGFLGGVLGNAGASIISMIIGAIVEVAVQKLLDKAVNTQTTDDDRISKESHSTEKHHSHSAPVKGTTSTLQDNFDDVKLSLKDAIEAVSSVANENTPSLKGLVDNIKDVILNSVERSKSTVSNKSKLAFENVAGTSQNVVDNLIEVPDKQTKKKKNKKAKKAKKESKKNKKNKKS